MAGYSMDILENLLGICLHTETYIQLKGVVRRPQSPVFLGFREPGLQMDLPHGWV